MNKQVPEVVHAPCTRTWALEQRRPARPHLRGHTGTHRRLGSSPPDPQMPSLLLSRGPPTQPPFPWAPPHSHRTSDPRVHCGLLLPRPGVLSPPSPLPGRCHPATRAHDGSFTSSGSSAPRGAQSGAQGQDSGEELRGSAGRRLQPPPRAGGREEAADGACKLARIRASGGG